MKTTQLDSFSSGSTSNEQTGLSQRLARENQLIIIILTTRLQVHWTSKLLQAKIFRAFIYNPHGVTDRLHDCLRYIRTSNVIMPIWKVPSSWNKSSGLELAWSRYFVTNPWSEFAGKCSLVAGILCLSRTRDGMQATIEVVNLTNRPFSHNASQYFCFGWVIDCVAKHSTSQTRNERPENRGGK